MEARAGQGKKPLSLFWTNVATAVGNLPETYPHSLPSNPRRLWECLREYIRDGYESLISRKFTNANTVKITPAAGEWLVAQWMSQVDRTTSIEHLFEKYNLQAAREGWKELKSSRAIRIYLYRPEIERIWYAHRYGELKARERYQRQNRTILPSCRDALWYSDGTKLNYYFRTRDVRLKTYYVYEVMDVYSEVLLGYHISEHEDFEAQYNAYRMAIRTSGHKPYEIKYDNQGGHKRGENSNFLLNVARHAIRTTPHTPPSR